MQCTLRTSILVCAIALLVGCTNSNGKDKNQMAMKSGQTGSRSRQQQPWARGNPTTMPSVDHPLAGAWELAVPRRKSSDAAIIATDPTHLSISAGNNWLSGDYVQQGNFLLILSNDERQRPICWRINSNDSLTLIRATDSSGAPSKFLGTTLLRAPEADSMAETDMGDIFGE
jgi:hypothetical protein